MALNKYYFVTARSEVAFLQFLDNRMGNLSVLLISMCYKNISKFGKVIKGEKIRGGHRIAIFSAEVWFKDEKFQVNCLEVEFLHAGLNNSEYYESYVTMAVTVSDRIS
ncbi:hypothetical protein CWI37_1612p0010 [Hamiltosporidium tvaerminnensis]|uniref:Uncharacterized protein n=1 Tax=Hamiltosporidium tvaerminnensis TaxID=1176355 RepID=A0A4Q9KVW5_9MICR|nr:hypothetical protein CWI37_1612p0010 [Hamiltosporidium tvaerminnensis]